MDSAAEIGTSLTDAASRKAVEVGEEVADGCATEDERTQVWDASRRIAEALDPPHLQDRHLATMVPWVASQASNWLGYMGFNAVFEAVRIGVLNGDQYAVKEEEHLPTLVREIFGNPFRSVGMHGIWMIILAAIELANASYRENTFERMPILADALEEGGCVNMELLQHCRERIQHLRGCWVLDLVLTVK